MHDHHPIKVLFLPAWYPHKHDPMFGLFVKQHALTLKPYAEVSVLNVVQDKQQKETYSIETQVTDHLTEVHVYYKSSTLPFAPLRKVHSLWRYIRAQKAGWEVIKNSSGMPDVCHVHILTRTGVLAWFLKRFKGIPYLITEHWSRYFPHNDHFKNPLHRWFTGKIVKRASKLTTVSEALKQAMQKKGLKHPDWTLLHNVVDSKRFKPLDVQRPDDKVRVFHISCFEDKSKNISGLLRAWAECIRQKPQMELVLIGDGPDKEDLEDYASELGINGHVHFTGVLEGDEFIDTIHQCDFSALFSRYETFGIVVPESLACGKPVVASKVGALPEILPEAFGILVEPEDEQALTKAILKMADDHSHYDADEMHAYVAEHFDTKAIGYQLYQLYRNSMKDKTA